MDGDATDSVASNDLTVNGPVNHSDNGKINEGYIFDGSNDDLNRANSTFLELQTFSVNFWVKVTTAANNYVFAYGRQLASPFYGWVIVINSGGAVNFFTGKAGGYNNIVSTATLPDTNYHMVTLTLLASGGVTKIYVDGSLHGDDTFSISPITYNASYRNLKFGEAADGAGQNLHGCLDEVGFWSKVLSQSEITQLYNSGTGFQYPFTSTGLNLQLNIGDAWKAVPAAKINIGDTWKDVAAIKQNIGDVWKDI